MARWSERKKIFHALETTLKRHRSRTKMATSCSNLSTKTRGNQGFHSLSSFCSQLPSKDVSSESVTTGRGRQHHWPRDDPGHDAQCNRSVAVRGTSLNSDSWGGTVRFGLCYQGNSGGKALSRKLKKTPRKHSAEQFLYSCRWLGIIVTIRHANVQNH